MTPEREVVAAAAVLAAHGLVDAFGHVSARAGDLIALTPARPLGDVRPGDALVRMTVDGDTLPDGAPKEAWIHQAIYARRLDVGGICRAQPPAVLACGVAGIRIRALHGQGALLGREVPVHDDATLARDRERGEAAAQALGDAAAVVLRGNGAVTVGASPGLAAARMYVLEGSARLHLAIAGRTRTPLRDDEYASWSAAADEILRRLWAHLASAG